MNSAFDNDVFEQLTTEQKLEAFRLLEIERTIHCSNDYYTFFQDAWKVIEPGTPLRLSKHIKYLCDLLGEQIKKVASDERPDYDKIIINVPPSTSKSTIVTKILPVWCWLQNASMRIITSSFDEKLATDHTVKSRDIIVSDWFQDRWGDIFKLKSDQNEKKSYYNNKTGIRKAVTTKGGKTGFHCHLYIEDDPIDPHKALSQPERETAIRDHDQVIPSRMLENSLRIVVQQRVHEKDTTGHILSKLKEKPDERILHVCLPAELTKDVTPGAEHIYTDGLLDPVRLSRERLQGFRTDLGSVAYAGQYLQTPHVDGGNKIKTEWIQYIEKSQLPNLQLDMWIDGAYTKRTENDPTGIMVCGMYKNNLYVVHFEEKHQEMPELLKNVEEKADLLGLNYKSRVYIEPKASGKTLKQLLHAQTPLNPVEIKSHLVMEGKEARIQAAAPKFEAGRVYLVRASWNDAFVGQLTGFPNAEHDEAVDLIGYSCEKYFKKKKKKGIKY